jgi:hypothetical protein
MLDQPGTAKGALMAKDIEFDMSRFIREHWTLIVTTRYVKLPWVKFRLWIALRLCILASWIGGFGLKVNQEVGVIVEDTDLALRDGKR